MSSELTSELRELQESIRQSSEYTLKQIQIIDSTLLVKSFITLILSLGFAYVSKILIYWVPASFVLMYLWLIYSSRATFRSLKRSNIRKVDQAYERYGEQTFDYGYVWFFVNSVPIVKAVSLIYGVTFIVLLLIQIGILPVARQFSIIVPVISALIFILPPFFLGTTIEAARRGELTQSYYEFRSLKGRKALVISAIVILAVFYVLSMIVLPGLSLSWTRYMYLPLSGDSLFLILVLLLQIIIMAMFASYFSALSAKKELTNSLTNFANISDQVSNLLLSEDINKDAIEKLKEQYLSAKQYDLVIDDYFKFVNYYFLSMHKVYLNRLQKK